MGPTKYNILCLVYHGVFDHFPTIPDHFKISEDYRRVTKMLEDYLKISKKKSKMFRLHFCHYMHMGNEFFFVVLQVRFFFSEREILVIHSN